MVRTLVVVAVAVLLCCGLAAATEEAAPELEERGACYFSQLDWNLQGSPQPCSCNAKVFLLSENSITVSFKTRVYATQVKVYLAPLNSAVPPTTTTTSTTTSSTTTTSSGTTTTFGNIFGRGDSLDGVLEVQLIGSNGQVVSIYDVQSNNFFDGPVYDCFTLTITPPALPFRVQKIKLIGDNSNYELPVRGVRLFGFSDQPVPTNQVPDYFFTDEGCIY